MKIYAPAKINLSLDIVGKREDGYHLLRMIMESLELSDELTITKNSTGKITTSTNSKFVPDNKKNLAYRTAELVLNEYGITDGVDIVIKKNIPVAAGLAGGSTDAAAVIKGLNSIFDLKMDVDKMKALGLKIGADVPYCIEGGTALSEGIGEVLTPLRPLRKCPVILIKPDLGVSTKEVYTAYARVKEVRHPDTDALIKNIEETGFVSPEHMANVLEEVTIPMVPVIDDIKKDLMGKGAFVSMMSGSGPTVFALFEDEDVCGRVFREMKDKYRDMRVILTKTGGR
ncbi:MAG: 4-(cytidine 5'-diphospho)-2-C-methyl-D-erythritol kinase [Lachnospiraceae bacterium]|nr:4-(cytidine 5'-diphospho)-2-C-methyl-D-erythritol kinase [Lachnospiraceae bacterium]